jgi:hypothetical protein
MTIIYIHPSIQIKKISNKGDGIITNNNLNANEIILIEKPNIFINNPKEEPMFEILYNIYNYGNIKDWNNLVPNKLLYNTLLTNFMHIKNKKIKNWLISMDKNELLLSCEKYKQNAFNMDNSKKNIKPCILFIGAKFNHSCNPNINFRWDNKLGAMIFYTNQIINKNTELQDNYIDITLPYENRQKRLQEQYKFICNCNKCLDKN